MREYIITDKQLKTATEAYLEHELSRPITAVFISGDKLPEIVRCRDCKHYGCEWVSKEVTPYFKACYRLHAIEFMVEPDGFCAWAEKRTDE